MNFAILWFCVFLTAAGSILAYEYTNILMENVWRLSEASNQFGLNLLRDLANRTSKNIIFSPISIATTFGILHFGSRGKTAKELEKVLGYEDANLTRLTAPMAFHHLLSNQLITVEPIAYVLELANTMFANERLGLNSVFKAKVEELFLSPVEVADFSVDGVKTIARINEWVRNITRGNICGILDYLDPSVDLVSVNAAYFKSRWMSPFLQSDTKSCVFYNGGTIRKSVSMMKQEGVLIYYKDDDISLVHLGFWGRNISILILLPNKMDGLLDLEKSITQDKLIYYLLIARPKNIRLTIPKFNISFSTDLIPSLQALGAIEIFQPNLTNLTGMVQQERVSIGEVRHKAIIDVNEAGVEASGVTATLSFKSMPLHEAFDAEFTADHPFMFVILDERTDLVVFMGRVWTL